MQTRFLQLASPALPVGAYSYSQGLEWAIESGAVSSTQTADVWIRDHLQLVFARFEAPLYVAAFGVWAALSSSPLGRGIKGEGRGAPNTFGHDANALSLSPGRRELMRLNAAFIASRESAEPRAETVQVGFSYAAWCREVAPLGDLQCETLVAITSPCAPVVASLAACACGLSARDGLLAYVFGFAENQVMVLAKALPLGQIASQKMLFALSDAIETCVNIALDLPEDNWSSASPLLAISQMKHETQYSRLFRS